MTKNKKLLLAICSLATLGVVAVGVSTNSNFAFTGAENTNPTKQLILNADNAPTTETTYQSEVTYTGIQYSTFTFKKVKAVSGKLCGLDVGGSISKDAAKGLNDITATFTGLLTINTMLTSGGHATSYKLVSGAKTEILGNYFEIVATSEAVIESIEFNYSCVAEFAGWKEEKVITPSKCNFTTVYNPTGFTGGVRPQSETGGSATTKRYIVKDEALSEFVLKASVEINNNAGSDFEFGYAGATDDGVYSGVGLLFRDSGLMFNNNNLSQGSAGVSFSANDLKVGSVYKMEFEVIKYSSSMVFNLYKSGETTVYKTYTLSSGVAATGRPMISIRNHSGAQEFTFTHITLSTSTPEIKWAPAKTYIPAACPVTTVYTKTGMNCTFAAASSATSPRYIIKDEAMSSFTIKTSVSTDAAVGTVIELGYAHADADTNWYGVGMLFRPSGLLAFDKSGTFGAITGAPTYAADDFKVGSVWKFDLELIKNGTSMTLNAYKSGSSDVYKTVTVNDAAATGKPCISFRQHQQAASTYELSNIKVL